MACLGGNLEIVEDLITNKSQSILFPDNDGRMALHWACVGKHFEIIRYLQDLGMNVKEPDKHLRTPLMEACYWGCPDAVDYLLNQNCPTEVTNEVYNVFLCSNVNNSNCNNSFT
jgi:ankyrin repeat protein